MKSTKLNTKDASILFLDANDVLSKEDARILRDHDLRRGLILGNMYKESTRIIYSNEQGVLNKLNARITALTEKNVVLENNTLIPIHRVHDVIV